MGSRSRSSSSNSTYNSSLTVGENDGFIGDGTNYTHDQSDNSVYTDNSSVDNSYTDNSYNDNSYNDNSSYSYTDSSDRSFNDNSSVDNSFTDNSTTDNSFTDNSDRSFNDNSTTDNSFTDTSDNSFTDNSDRSFTDTSDNSFTDTSDNSFTDTSDNSFTDNSDRSFTDTSDNSFTDNSVMNYVDAGALAAGESIALNAIGIVDSVIASNELVTTGAVNNVTNIAARSVQSAELMSMENTKFLGGVSQSLNSTFSNIAATNAGLFTSLNSNNNALVSDLISAQSLNNIESLRSVERATDGALSVAANVSRSDDVIQSTSIVKYLALAAGAVGVTMALKRG